MSDPEVSAGAQVKIEVVATGEALARAAADRFILAAGEAIRASGRFVVALSGGLTPKRLYTLLASTSYVTEVDWSRVHWFWTDERCVPPGDPASNYRMAREALLDRVPIAPGQVHRIRGEDEPWTAAEDYERTLRDYLAGAPVARLDLVLLGMGVDGHTASLFPGGAAVQERQRWVTAEYVRAVAMWRVTLTPVLIDRASEVMFLVSGREKAATLGRVLEGPFRPDLLPAQVIAPPGGRLRWLVDAAAAEALSTLRHRP